MILSTNCFALVDYTEHGQDQKSLSKTSTLNLSSKNSDSRSLSWKSDLSFDTNYEVSEIDSDKIGFLNINAHVQTPVNIFVDISYWNANNNHGNQNGNTKAILGFNWLRFGSPNDEAKFDIFGGGRFASNSELASSKTDKIFGFETTKRFGSFGLGIGFDLTLVGLPKKETEMSTGNIQRISVSSGWMVSNDIQFELEIENFKIQNSSDSRENHLLNSVSFSSLSPKLNLSIAPAVNLELGARYRTNKAKSSQDLKLAKLYELHGIYSNSLFTGLNISL